jgi:hypothetical protein
LMQAFLVARCVKALMQALHVTVYRWRLFFLRPFSGRWYFPRVRLRRFRRALVQASGVSICCWWCTWVSANLVLRCGPALMQAFLVAICCQPSPFPRPLSGRWLFSRVGPGVLRRVLAQASGISRRWWCCIQESTSRVRGVVLSLSSRALAQASGVSRRWWCCTLVSTLVPGQFVCTVEVS